MNRINKITMFLLIIVLVLFSTTTSTSMNSVGTINVYYSPKGGCTEAIIKEIDMAKKEILIQSYSFSSKPIGVAIVNAYKRGVNIQIVIDGDQESANGNLILFFYTYGIVVMEDKKHAISHNKIMIIDQTTLITGSFNFSRSAETSNAENLLIIKNNPNLIKSYIDNFKLHKAHSVYSIYFPVIKSSGVTK